MEKGKLIVIEGSCDGIGKTTQKDLLKSKLKKSGYNVLSHHFPSYGEPQAMLVEKYLKGELGDLKNNSPYFINTIYAIDRAIIYEQKLKKHIDDGEIVLLDRYTTSSLIYQGALMDNLDDRKEFINYVNEYEYQKLNIKEPDLVIFLKAPYECVQEFSKDRTNKDLHEQNDEYMKKVYDNANFIADYLNWSVINYVENGKLKTIDEINNEIIEIINKKLNTNIQK